MSTTGQLKQSEKQFEAAVVEYSKLNGWLSFHAFDSRRSEPGFPDRVFVRGTMIGDFLGDVNDVTITMPACYPACPPLSRWPDRYLVMNLCPRCSTGADPIKTVRELKARRLLEER